jgi:hypothetical protein
LSDRPTARTTPTRRRRDVCSASERRPRATLAHAPHPRGLGKPKRFAWKYDATTQALRIVNERGRGLRYTLAHLTALLEHLERDFGAAEIPLANNVAKLGDGSEQPGLGTALLRLKPGDVSFAQGASYLGVVLEDLGYLRWNGRHRGIGYVRTAKATDALERSLTRYGAHASAPPPR